MYRLAWSWLDWMSSGCHLSLTNSQPIDRQTDEVDTVNTWAVTVHLPAEGHSIPKGSDPLTECVLNPWTSMYVCVRCELMDLEVLVQVINQHLLQH